ncbi:MAG TPA: hypothetical protein H9981_03585 [Candidatus Mediterraneibacter caccavium]|uniref:Uncharacterized protein n=1 Tax=Candidatus Mediterraneibacter caccavium TaxID=2838661 RepID=A0A9D2AT19_9FIRM|nr:hypothetical protein [Candidatus Mediterraneibacter caccavium]
MKTNCGGDPEQGKGPELEEAVLQGVSGKHTAGTEGWPACVKGGKAA